MSLSNILNLSQPRLVAVVLVGSVAVVGFALHSLQYNPKVWDACERVPITSAIAADGSLERVTERYLEQTRNWSQSDYCVVKNSTRGNEQIVSVYRRGRRVGGGEGFQIRIDPVRMAVTGELAPE